jgi:hypothetical protein
MIRLRTYDVLSLNRPSFPTGLCMSANSPSVPGCRSQLVVTETLQKDSLTTLVEWLVSEPKASG